MADRDGSDPVPSSGPLDAADRPLVPSQELPVEGLSERAARGVALATLAVACVVVGPAPRLLDSFERTYVVALADQQREADRRRRRVPGLVARYWRPAGARPARGRP